MTTNPVPLDELLEVGQRMPPAAANYLLSLTVSPKAVTRAEALSYRGQTGELTPAEREELQRILWYDALLSILHSRARRALKAQGSAPSHG